jgi:hypothetical protein
VLINTRLFLWTFAYQTVGGAIVVPAYFLAHTWITSSPNYLKSAATVPVPAAKALLPSLIIGYLLPTIALFFPWTDIKTVQAATALWQIAPLFPIVLLAILPSFFSDARSSQVSASESVRHIKGLMSFVAYVTAIVHIGTMIAVLLSTKPDVTFINVFLPRFSAAKSSPIQGLHFIFQIDFWIIFAAGLAWMWQQTWDLRLVGAAQGSLLKSAFKIVVGSVLLGPGYAMCLGWSWREEKLLWLAEKSGKRQ